MKNYLILIFIADALISLNPANASWLPKEKLLAQTETVGVADLGVENPGLLPTNPFYFLKEWGRGIRRFFTSNPASQVELELEIANEKAAELKKIEEVRSKNEKAISDALKNYQRAQKRVKKKFEELKENSQNPNIDKLLDKFAVRAIQHERVISELKDKFSEKPELKILAEKVINAIEESAAAASIKDKPENFALRFEKAVKELKTEGVINDPHSRAIQVIEGIKEKVPQNVREPLENILIELQGGAEEEKLKERESNEEKDLNNQKERILDNFFEASSGEKILPPSEKIKLPCPELKKENDNLWTEFKLNKISDQDYEKQYQELKIKLSECSD